jgi:hypothetical protein
MYTNATKMCKDDNKRFDLWLENKSSKEMISYVDEEARSPGIPGDSSIIIVKDGPNDLRGTYVHQLLLPHILSWLSPKFAIRVSKIVNQYAIDIKDKTIFNLETMIKENREYHDNAMKKADQQMEQQKIQYESTISEIKAQAEASRKDRVIKYNDLVKRSNDHRIETKERYIGLQSQYQSLQTQYQSLQNQYQTLQLSTKAITDHLITMNIKNDNLRTMVVDVHSRVLSMPIDVIKPDTRQFDVVVKPPKKALQSFLILTVIKIVSPVNQNRYVVNRIQWRNHKTAVETSIRKALSNYENPNYDSYYAYFESSASAITVWNSIKSQFDISGCMLNITDSEFYNLVNQLRKINIRPEDEIKILNEEYERLKNSNDEQDKIFLAEIESEEDF